MFKKILIPLDGSRLARRALSPALKLARRAGAVLTLVRVPELAYMLVPGDSGHALLYPDQSLNYSEKQAREYLGAVRQSLAAEGLLIEIAVPRGDTARAITEAAEEAGADLIVMSSHGYSGVTRWLLGSVAEKVLRSAPCPVLAIRSPEAPSHMVIPLDGSHLAEQVLEPALEVAAGLGLKVTLMRAVPSLDRAELERLNQLEPGMGWRVDKELADEAQEYLTAVIHRLSRPDLPLAAAVRFEPAAEAVLDFAELHQADLIAMATHGRSGLQRWVYGSVTEKVLHGAHLSMLVVRPQPAVPSEAAVGPVEARLPLTVGVLPP